MFQNQPLRTRQSKIASMSLHPSRSFPEMNPGKRIHSGFLKTILFHLPMSWIGRSGPLLGMLILAASSGVSTVRGNIPGGGTGSGPNVTVTEQGDWIILSNGICTIKITRKGPHLDGLDYTYNNNGAVRTSPTLKGPGQYYYGGFSMGGLDIEHMNEHASHFTYTLAVDPTTNGGNYGDVMMVSDTANLGVIEVHFSMLRGSPGFYSTAIQTHRAQDLPVDLTAWGVVTRVPGNFNWLSADDARNMFIGIPTSKGTGVPNSPHEISVALDGTRAGQLDDKFIYGQDHSDLKAWGWSSVGPGGLNIGRWMMTTMDFSNGGPMKRDVSAYPYSELNNSILTGELGMGGDGSFAQGEIWTKTCGPWFMYLNSVPASITDPAAAAQALYQDALAQAEAEKKAWPYVWFKNPKYPQASGRGTVQGKLSIQDSGNPNATYAGIWVGLEEQPETIHHAYDFQRWFKPYQYWTQTDAEGNFTIANVLPGENYTLWAYGPGAAGTFLSQNQKGENPPMECDVPAQPFAVEVSPGVTKQLGTVTWTPLRVGATVFELGYPNRKADKYRHGDDYPFPDHSPKLGFPTPLWGTQMEFPFDFPNGLTYTLGVNRWSTDWNYILPSLPDTDGDYQPCKAQIVFNLATPPRDGAAASLYIAAAGYDGDQRSTANQISISVNGKDLGTVSGAKGAPAELTPTGYFPAYSDDSSIHFGVHGPFSDERLYFPGNLLQAGQNTITIHVNGRGLSDYLMVDYLRLELSGYIPPAPYRVMAFAGNNTVLVSWPVVPGATGYDILRSTSAQSGYAPVAVGKPGLVCGSDALNMRYADTTATNGTLYYYSVVSHNPAGQSIASPSSAGVMPAATLAAGAPLAPAGPQVYSSGHHLVSLSWLASPGASFYRVWRSTLHGNGVGAYYPLRTIMLNDLVVGTSFTDATPTDGTRYRYYVQTASPGGLSGVSSPVDALPLPQAPAMAPGSLEGKWTKTRQGPGITLRWAPVPGATGYVIYRSNDGKMFSWPDNYVTSVVETTWTDANKGKKTGRNEDHHIDVSKDCYYQVTAINAGGVSPSATAHVAAQEKGS
jgi:rhamnogalacturonan endolyase